MHCLTAPRAQLFHSKVIFFVLFFHVRSDPMICLKSTVGGTGWKNDSFLRANLQKMTQKCRTFWLLADETRPACNFPHL